MSSHIHALSDIHLTTSSIVSIGVFDGVHLGHQHLVRRLVTEARASGQTSVVLTFFPHPDVVLKGVAGRYYLSPPEERAQRLLDLGVDLVVTHAFNDEVRRIRAADFVAQLCTHLRMGALWVGADFALGYKREGNVDFLRGQGEKLGFTVDAVELELNMNNEVISSSRIREALKAGDVERVAVWLDRPYGFSGEVITGDRRGRTIGFPTANVRPWEEQILPANGVYACWTYVGEERHMAVTNVGLQPTFEGEKLKIEAHLLDFDRDIYGQTVRLEFVQRLRPEQRFSGVDELVAQIQRDVAAGREVLTVLATRSEG